MRDKRSKEDKQAAADARRRRMRDLAAQIAALTPQQRADLAARACRIVTCDGRALSAMNCCLIYLQRPSATLVGGFDQWRKLGRRVRKGEHGAMAWFPLGTRKATDSDSEGGADLATVHNENQRFGTTYYFDVSQTDDMAVAPVPVAVAELAPAPDTDDAPTNDSSASREGFTFTYAVTGTRV